MLPHPGSERQLLDLAALYYQDPFDATRAPWLFVTIEGLEAGRAALLAKMHHTISDGVGAVRLSAMFVDVEPDPTGPSRHPAAQPDGLPRPDAGRPGLAARMAGSAGDVANELARVPLDVGRRTWSRLLGSLTHPLSVPGQAVGGLVAVRSALGQTVASRLAPRSGRAADRWAAASRSSRSTSTKPGQPRTPWAAR